MKDLKKLANKLNLILDVLNDKPVTEGMTRVDRAMKASIETWLEIYYKKYENL